MKEEIYETILGLGTRDCGVRYFCVISQYELPTSYGKPADEYHGPAVFFRRRQLPFDRSKEFSEQTTVS